MSRAQNIVLTLIKVISARTNVVSVTRRSSGVAPRACVRVYARVLVPPNLYIHKYSSLCSCVLVTPFDIHRL